MENPNSQKVYVGLSGGVDSALAAALLKQQGYEVVGVFMKNWSGEDFGIAADCPWEEDQAAAEAAATALGIEFKSLNFEKEYRAQVVDYFFSEYRAGRTPNPDVLCNQKIKFGTFLQRALLDEADFIATGHYVQKRQVGAKFQLLRGVDHNKDQSYFLHSLNQEQLSRSLFPIGAYTKPQVRKMAADFGLPNFNRPDSQGICFIGEINVQEFLRSHITASPGEIVDIDSGKAVGKHDGVYYYTIGQREGLKIGGQPQPYFVVGKDITTNILYVGHGHNHPKLSTQQVLLESLHLIDPSQRDFTGITASARYRQAPRPGSLDIEVMKFTFAAPERAITSGQSLVIYDGEVCLGGGVIG